MRKFTSSLVLFFALPASLAAADPETENLKIQNLEILKGTDFCFRNEMKTEGGSDLKIPSQSKRVRCSLRQSSNAKSSIGRCPREDDFTSKVTYGRADEMKDPTHKEGEFTAEYLAHVKKNPKAASEAPPRRFKFGRSASDARGNSISHPFTRFKKDRIVYEETKKSVQAKDKREREKMAELAQARKSGKAVVRTLEDRKQELSDEYAKRQYTSKIVPLNELAITIDDDDFTAFVCYSKDKKFDIQEMTAGDLYDALKSKIVLSAFPEAVPSPSPDTTSIGRGTKMKTPSSSTATKKAL